MIRRKQKIKSQGKDLDEDISYEGIQNNQTKMQPLLGEKLSNVPAKREKKELNMNLNEQKRRNRLKFEIDDDCVEESISYQNSRFEDDEDSEGYETINVTNNEEDTQQNTKTENLIEPKCRTDLCNLCYDADRIFLIMQRDRFEFYYLKHIQQDKLIKWKKHIDRAAHQRQAEQQDIINLKPEECVI
ncbi:MAG: hypothetical protein EZS28_013764 [Streblomastix strix]|uniref:Uncharacterized protein n=1 Tax=Streblomastix strix TaxID=222440 RepID=A0A5J4W7D8_9EUKA|nr:MAG: hypothetical protein EZS28_013764 [Streblomastix strix]